MKTYFPVLLLITATNLLAQSDIVLNFNAYDSITSQTVPLDSVVINDLTSGADTVVYGPSPSLVLLYTGFGNEASGTSEFYLSDPHPNPTNGESRLILGIDHSTDVALNLYSFSGTLLYAREMMVNTGSYILNVYAGGHKRVVLSVQTDQGLLSKKILTLKNKNGGYSEPYINLSGPQEISGLNAKSTKGFVYNPGDTLIFIAFANSYHQGQIQASPTSNTNYSFSLISDSIFFCGYSLFDTRDSKIYAIIQIGTQCWMAENLNVGTMVNSVNTWSSHSDVSNNGVIEKYCYNNNPSYCTTYGGLYDWDEAMGYTTIAGAQGICPTGWHIPTDNEWKLLEGNVDSLYGVGNTVWNDITWRGYDAGGNLKESGLSHWHSPNTGATNSSGFTGLPSGARFNNGSFGVEGTYTYLWSSSFYPYFNSGWYRYLYNNGQDVYRLHAHRTNGYSVRCIRD